MFNILNIKVYFIDFFNFFQSIQFFQFFQTLKVFIFENVIKICENLSLVYLTIYKVANLALK